MSEGTSLPPADEAPTSDALVSEAELTAATQASAIVAAIVTARREADNSAISAGFLAFAQTVNATIGLDYDSENERATYALRALGELLVEAADVLADEADGLARFESAAS